MYKLVKSLYDGAIRTVTLQAGNMLYSIPFDPANTDYANFKKEILADEAQLQDADGLTLSSAEAQAYVSSLP